MAPTNLLYNMSLTCFQAADILSSAPAMQIRYLEAMQSMAKTDSAKVIFLPATNQTVMQQVADAGNSGEGPSTYRSPSGHEGDDFQRAIKASSNISKYPPYFELDYHPSREM